MNTIIESQDSLIPIIDVSYLDENDITSFAKVACELRKACVDKGFFYIKGHGVSKTLQAKVFKYSKIFFDQSLEFKNKYSKNLSQANRGYEELKAQTLEPNTPPDIKEGFYIGRERDLNDPLVLAKRFNQGPNIWPDITGFKEVMEEYQSEMLRISERLLKAVALSLDLDINYFDKFTENADVVTLRLLHYPPQPANAALDEKGCGAHTDFGVITLLLQDKNSGLQVWDKNSNEWIWATPQEGCYVVNIGDLLARWTNDLYKSTLHRVINVSGNERYSIPFFYSGNVGYVIETIKSCIEAGEEEKYEKITVEEHYRNMFNLTYKT